VSKVWTLHQNGRERSEGCKPYCASSSSTASPPNLRITQAAFDAIAKTLGSVGYENETNEKGERLIWLDQSVVDRLRSLRGPGESYSDVILRLAGEG
jgi:hypothetical protein